MSKKSRARFKDNTFFILWAIEQRASLVIDNLTYVYPDETFGVIQREFIEIQKQFPSLNFEFSFSPIQDIELCKNIEGKEKSFEKIVELLNTNIISFDIKKFVALMPYLAKSLQCEISYKSSESTTYQQNFKEYFDNQCPLNRIYSDEEHYKILKNYLNGEGKLLLPDPKAKLSRFTGLIPNYQDVKSRYNFFHYFKTLENQGDIQVRDVIVDENEPTIAFVVVDVKKFLKKKYKESKLIKNYTSIRLQLYNDKVVHSDTRKEVPAKPYMIRLLQHCLENEGAMLTRIDIGNITQCNQESSTTYTSAVNRVVQNVLDNNDFKILTLEQNQGDFRVGSIGDIPYQRNNGSTS